MLRLTAYHLLIGSIILIKEVNNQELTAAQICGDPMTTSATQTPFGVLCLIPKPVKEMDDNKLAFGVPSTPKAVTAPHNDISSKAIASHFQLIRLPFSQQLAERGSISNWLQKLSEYMMKQLRTFIPSLRGNHHESGQAVGSPDSVALQSSPFNQFLPPSAHHMMAPTGDQMQSQESMPFYPPFAVNNAILHSRPEQIFDENDDNEADDINADSQEYVSHSSPYNSEELNTLSEQIHEDTRFGHALVDTPHYGDNNDRPYPHHHQHHQQPQYAHSFNHNNQQQPQQQMPQTESSQSSNIRVEYARHENDKYGHDYYGGANAGQRGEIVLPLYTDVKARHRSDSLVRSSSALRPIVNNSPRQPIPYVIHDDSLESEICREEPFKPIVDTLPADGAHNRLTRKKRYISQDYSQMQLRRVPIWFPRRSLDSQALASDAIFEIKPRSLFRWRQPMQGWKPIVPLEALRKDIFQRRNGDSSADSSAHWDNDQVESQTHFQWEKVKPKQEENTGSQAVSGDFDAQESQALNQFGRHQKRARLLRLDETPVERRSLTADAIQSNHNDYDYQQKPQPVSLQPTSADQKSLSNNNQQIYSEVPQTDGRYVVEGIKGVKMRHFPDVSKAKSLHEISEIPGATLRPIDPKLTDVLVKILNHNSDFATKRITNAYFLEFPKPPKYQPDSVGGEQSQALNYGRDKNDVNNFYVSDLKSSDNLEINDDDVPLKESDFEYGEMLCDGKLSGSFADVRKDCRMYFQCTEHTVDTYVCPKGTRFDDQKQACRPYNDVVC